MKRAARASLIAVVVAGSIMPSAFAQQQLPYKMEDRIKSAQEIIQGNDEYIARARKLHEQMEKTIKVAETLKGKATDLQIKIDESKLRPHLTGAELKAAEAQYAGDLAMFKMHAGEYASHLANFKSTLGECHANDKLYATQVQKLQLHVERFHMSMPTIRPPHICGAMQLSALQSADLSYQLANDNKRVVAAETALNASENQLATSMAAQSGLVSAALKENRREVAEQRLAEEFAKLKEEYETLSIEHAALAGKSTGGKLTSESVHGSVKSK